MRKPGTKDRPVYVHPKSMCTCGHTGDGPDSAHRDLYQAGHGACTADDCDCKRFTWDHFTRAYDSWAATNA